MRNLSVQRTGEKSYSLNFPIQTAHECLERRDTLASMIGYQGVTYVGSNGEDCVVLVDSADELKKLSPQLDLVVQLPERGLIVSAPSNDQLVDFEYRAFFPKLGIPEDPVTGSACTALGPYWGDAFKKTNLRCRQISKRGGELSVSLLNDRVLIEGEAITVLEGEFNLQALLDV